MKDKAKISFKSISVGSFFLLPNSMLACRDMLYYKEDDKYATNLFAGAFERIKPDTIVKKIFLTPVPTKEAVIKEIERMNENIRKRENL